MPILGPSHDGMHPVEGDSAWSEPYSVNGYDSEVNTGLYTRFRIRPNECTMDVMLALWLPDNGITFVRTTREQKEICGSPLEVGGVRDEALEFGKHWRLTAEYRGQKYSLATREHAEIPVSLDLEFEA